jgi:glycosyltransferase involved in cell wall biosynthesis
MPGDDRIRLLFINHWAARLGGAEYSLLDLLEEAVRRPEIDKVFLVTSEQGELVRRASALGVVCHCVPCSAALGAVRRTGLLTAAIREWRGMVSFFAYVLRLRRLVASIKPHCIHANVPKSHVTLFLLARSGYRGACCYHVREIFEPRSAAYLLYAFLFRARRASVLAISKAVFGALPLRMQKAASVVYNGVALPPCTERPSQRPALRPRFLYLGRVVPWKGCHLLIEAFSQLHDRRRESAGTLDIIGDTLYGDPSYRSELLSMIERRMLGAVCRLLPHTEEPISAFRDHDIFCIASHQEPFGRVVAEAQGCGLPVIGFADGGVPEIVEQGVSGFLVAAGDTAAFASAMERFIDNPDITGSMGRAARARAERFFNRAVQTKTIIDRIEQESRMNMSS